MEEFRQATAALTLLVQSDIRDLLSSFGPSSDPARLRDLMLEVFPDFMTAYGDTAAVLGADFYDALRSVPVSAGSFQTVFAEPAKTKQSEGVVRWAAGSLFGDVPSVDAFEKNLLGAAQRLVLMPARGTVDLLAQADARSGRVAATSWSRELHPERAKSKKSCKFCIMLAGRGSVYRSDAAAGMVVGRGSDRTGFDADGNRLSGGIGGGVKARGSRAQAKTYHDNCHCVPVPTFYTIEVRPFTVRGFTRDERVLVPIAA